LPSSLDVKAQIVRDHYHLKASIWCKQLGVNLFTRNRHLLEAVLNCKTKDEYESNVKKVLSSLQAYPQHVTYLKGYFDDPDSIARYSIARIRGGLCTISSAAAEQMHSSNETHVPTKLMGIVSPEQQMYELVKRSDDWIRRDLMEDGELEFEQERLGAAMDKSDPQFKALHALTRYSYNNLFLQRWKRKKDYRVEVLPSLDGDKSIFSVVHITTGKLSSSIVEGCRCDRDECVSWDIQCVHEMAIDEDFILEKWQTRFWNNNTYKRLFGEGNHLHAIESIQDQHETPISQEDQDLDFAPIVAVADEQPNARNSTTTSNVRRSKNSNGNPTYTHLMNEFGSLAEDLVRHPDLGRIMLGFFASTRRLLSDNTSTEAHRQFLESARHTRSLMESNFNTIDEELVVDAIDATDLVQQDDFSNSANDASTSMQPLVRTRSDTNGAVRTNRIRSFNEQNTCGKARSQPNCPLCGKPKHRVNGNCERRQEFGYLIDEKLVDQLIQDLMNQNPNTVPFVDIPNDVMKLEQIHPETNYICIHGIGYSRVGINNVSQGCLREDSNYVCISKIFGLGVVTDSYDKCFVRTSKVISWISKSMANRKKIIIADK
jgi:hypothetical protein